MNREAIRAIAASTEPVCALAKAEFSFHHPARQRLVDGFGLDPHEARLDFLWWTPMRQGQLNLRLAPVKDQKNATRALIEGAMRNTACQGRWSEARHFMSGEYVAGIDTIIASPKSLRTDGDAPYA